MSDVEPGVRLRPDYGPQVRRFGAQMRRKLRLNRRKDGWLGDGDKIWLMDKLGEECDELIAAVLSKNLPAIVEEAGDVGNVAMILALLVPPEEWPEVEPEDLGEPIAGEAALLAAVLNAKVEGAHLESEGMLAFNTQRVTNGMSPGYAVAEFDALLERWGITQEKLDALFDRLTRPAVIPQVEQIEGPGKAEFSP